MNARTVILAGAFALMTAPAAWAQQTSEETATAQREAAAAAAIEAQVAQAQAQAQVEQAQAEVQSAQREMEAARAQLERAAREVAIQTRRAAGAVGEDGFIRFNGATGPAWWLNAGRGAQIGASLIDAESGALVTGVAQASGAADAGLQVGDVIRSIDGINLAEANEQPVVEVINRLSAIEPGASVELVVERAGAERDISVVTQEGAASPFVISTANGQQVFLRADVLARNGELYATRIAQGQAAAAGGRGGPVVLSTGDSLNTIRLFNLAGAPWGDMELVALTPELGRYFQTTEGLLVVRAPSDDAVGLQDGDVILSIGGREPTSAEHAIRILGSFGAGEVIEFSLMRDGRRQPLEYTVEEGNFQYFSPNAVRILPPAAPAAPATAVPGARARGAAPAPSTPAPTPASPAEPVSPTSL